MSGSSGAGKSWHNWLLQEAVAGTSESANASRSPSPSSTKGDADVLKLPSHDMGLFGECPMQDEFALVVCDICHRTLKLESFQNHIQLRHDGGRQRGGSSSSAAQRGIRQCIVELTKEDLALTASISNSSLSSTSTSAGASSANQSGSPSPPALSSLPPPSSITKQGSSIQIQPSLSVNVGGGAARSSIIIKPEVKVELMAVDEPPLAVKTEEEEADSTTSVLNNVISIPDTDPLPHSVSNDLMAMVSQVTGGDIKMEDCPPSPDAVTSPSPNNVQIPHQVIKLQVTKPQGIQQIPPRKMTPTKKGGGSLLTNLGNRGGSKPQREYHPDRHCGVWDGDLQRNCTRALTCKSHSVLLKRKITGRSKPFDELVAEHKASKEAAAAAAASGNAQQQQPGRVSNSPAGPVQPQPLLTPNAQLPVSVDSLMTTLAENDQSSSRIHSALSTLRPKPMLQPLQTQQRSTVAGVPHSTPSAVRRRGTANNSESTDENLYYTNDHPRPLAVCTYGIRRIGGTVATHRSQLLTRKIVRMALASGGYRLGPSGGGSGLKCFANSQQVVVTRPMVMQMPGLGSRIGLTSGGVPISIATEGSFKTDMQDFKGGIKFELGRQIKHITPVLDPQQLQPPK